MQTEREKQGLQTKFTGLEQEKADQQRNLRYPPDADELDVTAGVSGECRRSDVCSHLPLSQLQQQLKQAEAGAADLRLQLEEATQKVLKLEQQLTEQRAARSEVTSLHRELQELRAASCSQQQKLAQSCAEAEQSRAELASLEVALSLLHLKEVWGGSSHAGLAATDVVLLFDAVMPAGL